MIQLTDVFCVQLRYNGTSLIRLQYASDSIIRDPIKRRALYSNLQQIIYVYNVIADVFILLKQTCRYHVTVFQTYKACFGPVNSNFRPRTLQKVNFLRHGFVPESPCVFCRGLKLSFKDFYLIRIYLQVMQYLLVFVT